MRMKTRIGLHAQSVKTGVATISVKTEVLTPVNDPQIKSQLVQQLTNGELKFDIDAGRVLSQQIDWDETVVGFSGDDSLMKYLARFTEELSPSTSGQQAGGTQSSLKRAGVRPVGILFRQQRKVDEAAGV